MAIFILNSLVSAGLAVAAAAYASPGPANGGAGFEASSHLQTVQYHDRSRFGGREGLFTPPSLAQPRSLFRQRPGRIGPHYAPPPVVYEPPAVTYRPPAIAERTVRGRCAPRTRAWYDSCAARYRSFDPNRGTFTTYSGQERPCLCP